MKFNQNEQKVMKEMLFIYKSGGIDEDGFIRWLGRRKWLKRWNKKSEVKK